MPHCKTPAGSKGEGFKSKAAWNGHLRCCHVGVNPPPTPIAQPPSGSAQPNATSAHPLGSSTQQPSPQPPTSTLRPRLHYPLHEDHPPLPFSPAVRPTSSTPTRQDELDILAANLTSIFLRSHRIAPNVPAGCAGAFNAALLTALNPAYSDVLKVKLVQILPVTVLRLQSNGNISAALVKHRLHRFNSGDWRYLLEEAWHDANQPRSPQRPLALPPAGATQPASESFLHRNGKRAASLAQHGEYSKALRTLESDLGTADINGTTVAQLRALHPEERGFKGIAWDDDYASALNAITATSPFVIDASDVCKAATGICFKSSGGPSGLRISHLRDAILCDPGIATGLAALFTRIAAGTNHCEEMGALMGDCRLIALQKPDGGVRPIAIGETLRRLLGKVIIKQVASDARRDLEPIQVGVGTPNGGIAVFHSATAFHALHPDGVLINIDLKNAFNTLSRVAMFEHLRQNNKLANLIPLLRLYYLRSGNLIVHDGGDGIIIKSTTGAQQGDNFGTLLWSGGWQDALLQFKERTNYAVSFIDDGTFGLVNASAAFDFLRFVAAAAHEHNTELNYPKCTCVSNAVLPNNLRNLGVRCIDPSLPATQRGISLLEDNAAERGVTLQGIPIGTPEFQAAWLDHRLSDYEETFRRLHTYVPDRLAAAQILGLCIVPKISHILRALPPSVTSAFAKRFDDACVRCFTAIATPDLASVGLPPTADAIVRLKLRDGGFDIGSQHRACAAAYVASWAAASPLIVTLLPSIGTSLSASLQSQPQQHQEGDSNELDIDTPPHAPSTTTIAPLRALADAISQLPQEARAALDAFNKAAATVGAAASAATAATTAATAAAAAAAAAEAAAGTAAAARAAASIATGAAAGTAAAAAAAAAESTAVEAANTAAAAATEAAAKATAAAAAAARAASTTTTPAEAPQHTDAAATNTTAAKLPSSGTLQAKLSRPTHADSFSTLVNNLATTDAATAARLHSQAGFLGTAWFRRNNHSDNSYHISSQAFTTAIAIHLGLPLRTFDGINCTCTKSMNGTNAVQHINSCNQYNKLERSETFQTAFDSILQEVCPSASIEGAKPLHGVQRQCAAYATIPVCSNSGIPVVDPATGLQKMKDVIPDRVVRRFTDDLVKDNGRYIVDTIIVAPDLSSYIRTAARTPLSAAASAFKKKNDIYNPHLRQGDKLLAVVCETHGGLHDSVKQRLVKWAELIDKANTNNNSNIGTGRLAASLVSTWQRRLSTALLIARVRLLSTALDKIIGIPARSSTAAYRISHPLTIARELGRPWAGQ